jgi:chorismate dehydratase
MAHRIRLGVPPHFFVRPVVSALEAEHRFECVVDVTTQLALQLRAHTLDAALISPIDFAREGSAYSIIPGAAITSSSGNGAVTLHFPEGVHSVKSFAADPSSAGEIVLARVILSENFDIETIVVPAAGSLRTMLGKADAALLYGDASLVAATGHQNAIDLVEEWYELTGLPYVHALWCVHGSGLPADAADAIRHAHEVAPEFLDTALDTTPPAIAALRRELLKEYCETFSLNLDALAEDGIREYLNYAFYHGVLPDVPELAYFEGDDGGGAGDLSLN